MYSVLNTLGDYTYMYIQKNITLYTFLLESKIAESLHSRSAKLKFSALYDTRMKFDRLFL